MKKLLIITLFLFSNCITPPSLPTWDLPLDEIEDIAEDVVQDFSPDGIAEDTAEDVIENVAEDFSPDGIAEDITEDIDIPSDIEIIFPDLLCAPCIADEDCTTDGVKLTCIELGSFGKFCLPDCSICPAEGYKCIKNVCEPLNGICDCTPEFEGKKTLCFIKNSIGKCTAEIVCSAGSFTECSAKVPEKEKCDNIDNDCDGLKDEGDDNLPLSCDDNDKCTENDKCVEGKCAGTEKKCDDGNECTQDFCNPLTGNCDKKNITKPCEDKDPCTINDYCAGGECHAGSGNLCECMTDEPGSPANCDYLEDGNKCNGTLFCDLIEAPFKCKVDSDTVITCDPKDNMDCLKNTCQKKTGLCSLMNINEGGKCDDENKCTTEEKCVKGECSGKEIMCEDGNPCTEDSCNPLVGCMNDPDAGKECNDQNLCTENDKCQSDGSCMGTDVEKCGCDIDTDCGKYEDGDKCNGTYFCDTGESPFICRINPATIVNCDKTNDTECRKNLCVSSDGQCTMTDMQDGTPCFDGNLCSGDDKCTGGQCAGIDILCDDENICTNDTCDPAKGCVHENITKECDDNDSCTLDDACMNGECTGDPDPQCNCEQTSDCVVHEDGNLCNGTFICEKSRCVIDPATIVKCPDTGIPQCRENVCDEKTGKCGEKDKKDGSSCEDGFYCTVNDACLNGKCEEGSLMTCLVIIIDNCNDFVCKEQVKACVKVPTQKGIQCSDKCKMCDGKGICVPKDSDFDGFVDKACGGSDCDDGNPLVNPDAKETCLTDYDDDCNGANDNETGLPGCTDFYYDGDADGYYAEFAGSECRCKPYWKYSGTKPGDCDDSHSSAHPGLIEAQDQGNCNDNIDNDCDGKSDYSDPDCPEPCVDNDGDGHKDKTCGGDDCDDTNKEVYPGASETCLTDYDDDCEPENDNADGTSACTVRYYDGDSDGYYADGAGSECRCKPEGKFTAEEGKTGDCDDKDPNANPALPEILDGKDNNCDGFADENEDLDHDGVCDGCSGINAVDTCPFVWNPDNDPAICAKLGTGWTHSREITLSEPVAGGASAPNSTWRRTNEPIEVPLVNGILDDSVVGYWKLDGGMAKDHSGNGNDGILKGGKVTQIEGAFADAGGALLFDGATAFVVPKPVFNYSSGEMTIMAWFNVTGDGWIFYQTQEGQSGHKGLSTHSITNETQDNDFNEIDIAGTNLYKSLYNGKWHHIAGTVSGLEERLYIDGKLVGSLTAKAEMYMGGCEISIGCSYWHLGNSCTSVNLEGCINGAIDDIVFFSRALTPSEISDYYNSHRTYGTNTVPGAQADFDDVRITESGLINQTPTEIIGVKPHSDSPCPMETDDGTWKDRDDLCGVVGYWKLDGDGKDSSGNGYNGSVSGTTNSKGKFGDTNGALDFSNTGKLIVQDASKQFCLPGFTLEAWVYFNETPTTDVTIVDKGANGESAAVDLPFELAVDHTTNKVLCLFETSSQNKLVVSVSSLTFKSWTHTACSYDGNKMAIYINGIPENTIMESSIPVCNLTDVHIGSDIQEGPIHVSFPGKIDEVLVHNIAKSPEYIYRRANPGVPTVRFLAHTKPYPESNGKYDFLQYFLHWGNVGAGHALPILTALDKTTKCHGLLSPCLGYAGWWRFNEGSGTIAVDSSINKNNGTLVNGPVYGDGLEGTALAFDGTSQYVTILHNAIYSFGTASFTLEASGQQTGGNLSVLVSKFHETGGCDPRWELDMNRIHWDTASCSGSSLYGDTNEIPCPWTSVTGVIDRATPKALFYQDYSLKNQTSSSLSGVYDNSRPVTIAKINDYSQFFGGIIDSVRIMKRDLNPDEFLHYPLAEYKCGSCSGYSCTGIECGENGCCGSFGACENDYFCNNGKCIEYTGMKIDSDPPGAKIYLYGPDDWKDTSKVTPYTYINLQTGNYSVYIGKMGYYLWWDDRLWLGDLKVVEGKLTKVKAILVPEYSTGTNVALASKGATASASGYKTYGGYTAYPSEAIDGKSWPDLGEEEFEKTFWGNMSDGSWLKITLPSIKSIKTIVLVFDYSGYNFKVEGSTDDTNWFTLIPSTQWYNTAYVYTFTSPVDIKYAKFTGNSSGAPGSYLWRYIIAEFELWE